MSCTRGDCAFITKRDFIKETFGRYVTKQVSDATYRRLQKRVQAIPMEPVQVKGKSEPVKLYSLEGVL